MRVINQKLADSLLQCFPQHSQKILAAISSFQQKLDYLNQRDEPDQVIDWDDHQVAPDEDSEEEESLENLGRGRRRAGRAPTQGLAEKQEAPTQGVKKSATTRREADIEMVPDDGDKQDEAEDPKREAGTSGQQNTQTEAKNDEHPRILDKKVDLLEEPK